MCGICGITYFDRERKLSEQDIQRMCDAMYHRGPDDAGWYVKGNLGIGMRRLSIIDLVTGHQPISNEDGTIWIVFNGEIYNHLELRQELKKKGHKFQTRADTEAIVHAYEEYGEDCPKKLNGMFGFAIWDQRNQTLFLARDRLGIKPLYYYHDSKMFVFASELKSILQIQDIPRKVDLRALDIYLTFEYIPSPFSIFKDIAKLPPGHTLTLRNGKFSVKEYWDVHFDENKVSEQELCEQLIELLQDAVKIRLMSDVPLGAFLSGGIDSSSVVALMSRVMDRPVKTFSISFEEASYNETHFAQNIAKHFNTEHHEFKIKPNALDLTEKLIRHLDEPFGDFSIFPTYLVSKMAREYVTVSLSGDGGDELFAGYDTYIANKLACIYKPLPKFVRENLINPILNGIPPTDKKKGLINRAKRFIEGLRLPEELEHTRWMIFLQEAEKSQLYSQEIQDSLNGVIPYDFICDYFGKAKTSDDVNRQLYVDIKTYLADDILVKVDRMSMAVSLEARVPFLDHRFVEFTATIPSRLKLKGTNTKLILKKAMRDILPPKILKRGKEGFSIPIKNWLKNELRPLMLDMLDHQRIKREGFFDSAYVQQLTHEHLNGIENHSHRLWAMMVFEIWQDLYLRSERVTYEKKNQTSNQLIEI
ncbi:MAG: asparagine synthase (glutamine-hydrolyzing) [bacterium]